MDVASYLRQHETKPLLRLITCGSVDDGKSTLIGRLLHDSRRLMDDQLAALDADSRRHGTQGDAPDYALLLDGLAAEREQGITIDVAYRFFDTDRAKFIVADCPGHEQYTRNMATGASTADLAVVLVDARKGLLAQTRRHSYIVGLLGIRQVVLAVNKMDAVGFDEAVFADIVRDYRALAEELGIGQVTCIPVSALQGDNLMQASSRMPWYAGPALLPALESAAECPPADDGGGFCMPVQWVCRPDPDFRGFAGTVLRAPVAVGDMLVALPSGVRSRLAAIDRGGQRVMQAGPGEAVMLSLSEPVDVSRGDVLAAANDAPEVADQFAAHLLWMDEAPLLPGRGYWLQLGSASVGARISEIKHRVDVEGGQPLAAKRLELNAIGAVNLDLDRPLAFAPYAQSRALGAFVLVDRQTNATVGAGVIDFALRRAHNVHWQPLAVDKAARARIKGQQPRCAWFTGLSGSGKSTLADRVEKKLLALGHHTYLLDGDNLRHGLNRDLGFSDADRVENIRRVGEVARLMADAGLIVLASFISPFRSERQMVRGYFEPGEFIEVFVDTPLAECERRDAKGLYAKARAGTIPNFTGISSPYERPEQAELHLDAGNAALDAMAERVVERLLRD